jgi:hypothetical protein
VPRKTDLEVSYSDREKDRSLAIDNWHGIEKITDIF